MNQELDNKITQLRKGILELAVMGYLYQESHYGYSLVRALTSVGDIALKEGTIYPILQRMTREGMVEAEWVESSQGPPRKYYRLSQSGRDIYEALVQEFLRLAKLVTQATSVSEPGKGGGSAGRRLNIRKEES
jgi:PadR family transcriptional regulator, regulatory protein PadR